MAMNLFRQSVSRQVYRLCWTAALVAGLGHAMPAHAQLGLPHVNVAPAPVAPLPKTPQVPLVTPLPQTLPTPQLPSLPQVQQIPLIQSVPQVQPIQQIMKLPQLPDIQQPIQLPQTPALGTDATLLPNAVTAAGADALASSPVPLAQLRATTVRNLLRQHADVLEADPSGEPVRRQELLLLSPPATVLDAALAQGFVVLRDRTLPALDLRQVVVRPPAGVTTAQALALLRALGPQVDADFNHIYTPGGEVGARAPVAKPIHPAAARRIGLVDGGLDREHPALRASAVQVWGCDGVPSPSPHGTAVASLLVGRDAAFAGELAGARLFAADIYCGQPAGGAAETIALALAWLAQEGVAVVNISLVGPSNRLLERAVQAMNRKGFLLVAAVGNDGPAAPPLYPAAYAGVVGVTAVSSQRRVLPEAAQGPQVMFAAPGADLVAADASGGYTRVRGTSFAAPLVAGLLAQSLSSPNPAAAGKALARLATSAVDLGAPGWDPVFGLGLVGEGQVRPATDAQRP
ncbi:MAG: S8 family serine peptidase [Burkholderiaceae bacterium]|nr:S8 family serine peptidase [Burkholderiaceae bacterium]